MKFKKRLRIAEKWCKLLKNQLRNDRIFILALFMCAISILVIVLLLASLFVINNHPEIMSKLL